MLKFFHQDPMPTARKKAKIRAPRNRTIEVLAGETDELRSRLLPDTGLTASAPVRNKIVVGNAFDVLAKLSAASFDLLFADPPYNLTKVFGNETFRERASDEYEAWLDS